MIEQFPSMLSLSVGGVAYQVSHSLLLKQEDSVLASMFSGRHAVQKDEQGRYFIDRDGVLFAHILSFLRNGELLAAPAGPIDLTRLLREAQYFQIQPLVDELTQRLDEVSQGSLTYQELLEILNMSKGPVQLPRCRFVLMEISFLDFTRANLQGCDFTGSIIREVNLTYANLSHSILKDANLQNSCLREAVLEKCDLTRANLSGTDMRRAICRDCNFSKAKLSGADLRFCDMQSCNLEEASFLVANLENCMFHYSSVRGANFDRANMRDVQGINLP